MKTILFVCTGNTCRSPMAACMMNHLLAQAGLKDVQALSAGLDAWDGESASDGARHAMAARGLSLDNHRAQRVTAELLARVDWVICVGPSHQMRLSNQNVALPPMTRFSPAIPDPYGGPDAEYERCAAAMEAQLRALVAALAEKPDGGFPPSH